MRIVGGKWRGRMLKPMGNLSGVRPTSDRVREAIFNILLSRGAEPEGRRVLDLFAGTGAMGLEALSRGAAQVSFVEKSGQVARHLTDNIALFGEVAAHVITKDALRLNEPTGEPVSLCFCDPPYGKGLGQKALARAAETGWIAPDCTVILEENAEIAPGGGFVVEDVRRYGDTFVHVITYAPSAFSRSP